MSSNVKQCYIKLYANSIKQYGELDLCYIVWL